MPEQAPGARHTAVATKACVHGQIVTEDGFVGEAFKVDQPDRFVRPADADDIAIGTEFEIQLGGIQRAPAAGNLAAADVGDAIYIKVSDNTLGVAAQGLTAGALTAGWRKVGKVTEVDPTTNPDGLRINCNVTDQVEPL